MDSEELTFIIGDKEEKKFLGLTLVTFAQNQTLSDRLSGIGCFNYLILRLHLGHFQVGLSVLGYKVKENTLTSMYMREDCKVGERESFGKVLHLRKLVSVFLLTFYPKKTDKPT